MKTDSLGILVLFPRAHRFIPNDSVRIEVGSSHAEGPELAEWASDDRRTFDKQSAFGNPPSYMSYLAVAA